MDREDWIKHIKTEIAVGLNERYNDCVLDCSVDYDNNIIKFKVAEPFEGDDLEDAKDIIGMELPMEYDVNYTIDGCDITITIGRQLDEWEQDMKYNCYESSEEQYYATESIEKNNLKNSEMRHLQ